MELIFLANSCWYFRETMKLRRSSGEVRCICWSNQRGHGEMRNSVRSICAPHRGSIKPFSVLHCCAMASTKQNISDESYIPQQLDLAPFDLVESSMKRPTRDDWDGRAGARRWLFERGFYWQISYLPLIHASQPQYRVSRDEGEQTRERKEF